MCCELRIEAHDMFRTAQNMWCERQHKPKINQNQRKRKNCKETAGAALELQACRTSHEGRQIRPNHETQGAFKSMPLLAFAGGPAA